MKTDISSVNIQELFASDRERFKGRLVDDNKTQASDITIQINIHHSSLIEMPSDIFIAVKPSPTGLDDRMVNVPSHMLQLQCEISHPF